MIPKTVPTMILPGILSRHPPETPSRIPQEFRDSFRRFLDPSEIYPKIPPGIPSVAAPEIYSKIPTEIPQGDSSRKLFIIPSEVPLGSF